MSGELLDHRFHHENQLHAALDVVVGFHAAVEQFHQPVGAVLVSRSVGGVIVGGFAETDQADKSGRLRELLNAA